MPIQTTIIRCVAATLLALFFAGARAETTITDAPLGQNWVKRGILLAPGFAGARSAKFVSSPSVIRLPDGRLKSVADHWTTRPISSSCFRTASWCTVWR